MIYRQKQYITKAKTIYFQANVKRRSSIWTDIFNAFEHICQDVDYTHIGFSWIYRKLSLLSHNVKCFYRNGCFSKTNIHVHVWVYLCGTWWPLYFGSRILLAWHKKCYHGKLNNCLFQDFGCSEPRFPKLPVYVAKSAEAALKAKPIPF